MWIIDEIVRKLLLRSDIAGRYTTYASEKNDAAIIKEASFIRYETSLKVEKNVGQHESVCRRWIQSYIVYYRHNIGGGKRQNWWNTSPKRMLYMNLF